MRHRHPWRMVGAALALALLAGIALADWPQARHDGRRTALANGPSDIVQPVAYWKRYLGGQLAPAALLMHDVDGDGDDEVLMVAGGRAVAKRRTDFPLWQTQNLALIGFVGLADLDGDGKDELIAASEDRVHALDPQNGGVWWSMPTGELGALGAVRLGDVDGDDLPDLVVNECVCCRVRGTGTGFALSFASGLAAPTRLWDLPVAHCTGGPALTLVDIDGRNGDEVLYGDLQQLVLLDGQTGVELARSPDLGTWTQKSRCVGVDIDGARGEELICVQDTDFDPEVNARRVFALDRAGAALSVLWSRNLAPVTGGALSWVELVTELDGDPRPEIVVSALDGEVWTTFILDAVTGNRLARIDDEIAMGVLPTDDGPVLLTAAVSHLSGWKLSGPGDLQLDWTVLDAESMTTLDLARAARTDIASRPALPDLDSDGDPDIVAALRSEPGTLVGLSVEGGAVTERARLHLGGAVEIRRIWPLSGISDGDLALAVASSDGILSLLGPGLTGVFDGSDDVSYARLTTGGYYAPGWPRHAGSPRAASLDGGAAARILLGDARGALVELDARLGSFVAPPRREWEVPGASAPSVVAGLDGDKPGIACVAIDQPETTPPSYSILALDAGGGTLWRQPAPPAPFNDLASGNFDGDPVPDLAFEWGDPGDQLLHTRAVSGADGQTLWDSAPVEPGSGRKTAGLAIGRWGGDDLDDVYHQVGFTEVLSGADGSRLEASGSGPNYGLPTLQDVDGDGSNEVVVHGGPLPVKMLDDDLASVLFVSADNNRPFPYGAVAGCPDGRQILAQGSLEYTARFKLTDLSGAATGSEMVVVLAGGRVFPDEASALAAAPMLGQLNAATAHADLTGTGHATALVGSTDGWLYAIDACAGTLDWSYEFGSAVGEAVFADTDGDGRDEVLVTVEDGYLYTLRDFEIAAPASVRDTDPFGGGGADLDEIVTISSLEATWDPVEGAAGYQVAVADAEGNYIGEPWRDAGLATTLLLDDLPLEDGKTYRVGVRAMTAGGRASVDTVSNGIWVHLPPGAEDRPGDGGGCGCRTSNRTSGAFLPVLLALAALLVRRRRRP